MALTNREDLPYRIALSRVGDIGPMRFALLMERFGSARAAWEAPQAQMEALGLGAGAMAALREARRTTDPHREAARVEAAGFSVLTWDDPAYPPPCVRWKPLPRCSTNGARSPLPMPTR